MDMAQEMDFLLNYPAVVPISKDRSHFKGFIFVDNEAYQVDFKLINNKFNLEINSKLKPFESEIRELDRTDFGHPTLFLNSLSVLIKKSMKPRVIIETSCLKRMLNEYVEFKNFHLNLNSAILSSDLSRITIEHYDSKRRLHKVIVGLNEEKLFDVFESDLPDLGVDAEITSDASLITLYDKFLAVIESCQDYFDLMDGIDAGCHVLDPDEPRRKDNYRRIALTEKTSIVVTLKAKNIRGLPDIKFLGPRTEVSAFLERYNENYIEWDLECDVLDGILTLLELSSFPQKSNQQEDELQYINSGECCICFATRLDDKLPEIICPNGSCAQLFHTACLYQWLSSLNFANQPYLIAGPCPNCEKTIECAAPL